MQTDWNMSVTLWLLLSFVLFQKEVQCQYAANEVRLRSAILSGYETDVRPAATTTVRTSLILMFLNKLDMSTQTMSVTGIWYTTWFDDRLEWDPANYSFIADIVVNHEKVWKPSLLVKNEVESTGLIDKNEVPLRVFSDGFVVWTLPMTMNTMCKVNIETYPFDTQTCNVDLIGVVYSTDEVDLLPQKEYAVNTQMYVPHGEWKYISASVLLQNISDEIKTFRTLRFTLTFRRRWEFYSQYLLLPIILNSVLMISVFLVPIDSGEKLGFSLTVLLSYVVLLTMVTENLPPISTKRSVLQIYLSVLMIIGTITTLLTIWVLSLYKREETQRISPCLQKLTDYFLAPIACIPRHRRTTLKRCPPSKIRVRENTHWLSMMMMEKGWSSNSRQEWRSSSRHGALKEDKVKMMSYKEFATILDPFLFRVFAMALFIITTSVQLFFFVYNENSG